ncbi:MAG: DNA mismatch repair protein MutS [Deltaproteobacteria bacterium]|nr:DNA mismatch repair protein MutS [Deltaproteobacteria bacterium]
MTKITPMLEQYLEIKEKYRDFVLFYQLGDFFEMFYEDALLASRILEITLTSRHKGEQKDQIPMCGVPVHAVSGYVARMVEKGYKVALCEQVEDPSQAQGIVRREVTRLITPGLYIDDSSIKNNRYLLSLSFQEARFGLASVDLATGEFRVTEVADPEKALEEIGRINPSEILVSRAARQNPLWQPFLERLSFYFISYGEEGTFDLNRAQDLLVKHYEIHSLVGFGAGALHEGIRAAGALLFYLMETQKCSVSHLQPLRVYSLSQFMVLSETTQRHLELTQTLYRGTRHGSLISVLDQTMTAMGSRKLKYWLNYPLLDLEKISRRQNLVEAFFEDPLLRQAIRAHLKDIYDIERLVAKVCLNQAGPRDLVSLKNSLTHLPAIGRLLEECSHPLLKEIGAGLDSLPEVTDLISRAVLNEPSLNWKDKEARIIRLGYQAQLDQYLTVSREGKEWIANLEARERKRTGINSLKIGYNRVFGYYIEVSRPNLSLVPDDYQRKQTLVNGERFLTPELKEYEVLVLEAEEKRWQLEVELFQEVRRQVAEESARLQQTAGVLSDLDVLTSLAQTAQENRYRKPVVNDSDVISLKDSRHPVIEKNLPAQRFVPNSLDLDNEEQQMIIITGPNMAGKSTILRQTALICLMAQMGSFVPAEKAEIGLVDQIFTRVGASDDLSSGQSTFMVEMQETAQILHQASERSLVLLDEIGRGTSTFDGLSIAWAVAEFLHDLKGKGVKTLFATHYHELTDLTQTKKKVKNFHVSVKEYNQQIIFLRKLQEGGTSRSYGIQVARLAGIPLPVIERAQEVLKNLEKGELDFLGFPTLASSSRGRGTHPAQMELFSGSAQRLQERVKSLSIDETSPLQALMTLKELKDLVE